MTLSSSFVAGRSSPHHAAIAAALLLFSQGCFSPNARLDEDDDDAMTSRATESDAGANETGTSPTSTSQDTNSTDPTLDDSTTADLETSGSSDDDDPPPACGDGKVDDGEECDDGEDNGPGQACRADCSLNVCGDGDPGPDEACDNGPMNKLELGACAPDCSKVIEAREIKIGFSLANGSLGQNPVATMDGLCEAGYKALFAHQGHREFDPLTDWPLQPYTAYMRDDGELLWVTDSTPALGLRDGQVHPLKIAFNPSLTSGIITGLNKDWSTRNTKTCNGWASASASFVAARGDSTSPTDFLGSDDLDRGCDNLSYQTCLPDLGCFPNWTSVYCVHQ